MITSPTHSQHPSSPKSQPTFSEFEMVSPLLQDEKPPLPPEKDSNSPRFNRLEDAEAFVRGDKGEVQPGVEADEASKRKQTEELRYWNERMRLEMEMERMKREQNQTTTASKEEELGQTGEEGGVDGTSYSRSGSDAGSGSVSGGSRHRKNHRAGVRERARKERKAMRAQEETRDGEDDSRSEYSAHSDEGTERKEPMESDLERAEELERSLKDEAAERREVEESAKEQEKWNELKRLEEELERLEKVKERREAERIEETRKKDAEFVSEREVAEAATNLAVNESVTEVAVEEAATEVKEIPSKDDSEQTTEEKLANGGEVEIDNDPGTNDLQNRDLDMEAEMIRKMEAMNAMLTPVASKVSEETRTSNIDQSVPIQTAILREDHNVPSLIQDSDTQSELGSANEPSIDPPSPVLPATMYLSHESKDPAPSAPETPIIPKPTTEDDITSQPLPKVRTASERTQALPARTPSSSSVPPGTGVKEKIRLLSLQRPVVLAPKSGTVPVAPGVKHEVKLLSLMGTKKLT